MNKTTNDQVTYTSPAIERREGVAGLLSVQKGSYGPPELS